jgi:putative addiction module killer protein
MAWMLTRRRRLSPPSCACNSASNVKWFSGIGEYVIAWGPGYRIYLAMDGDSLIVLYGGETKRRQQSGIEKAKALHAEYKDSKAAARAETKGKRPKR